jgi:hypothetical protein
MDVLFVVPAEQGAGETITVLHVADRLVSAGHDVRFLATPFARRFLEPRFPSRVAVLTGSGRRNRELWDEALVDFRPNAVVFADYPLLFFRFGVAPLVDEPGWAESLEDADACLVTFDHFGFAQGEMGVFLGPAHLTMSYQFIPAIPTRLHVMLPCPMHEPGTVEGRRGEAFRYWDVPLGIAAGVRDAVRQEYVGDGRHLLVFHLVSNWAWQGAEAFGLSFYRYLPDLLEMYLGCASQPVTLVSVNNGRLLAAPPGARVRIVNLPPLPAEEFEALLFAADLVITENRVSISIGKAICGLQPCALLKNSHRLLTLVQETAPAVRKVILSMERVRPGTVYPYDVYPTGLVRELEELILFKDNTLARCLHELEVFGGEHTSNALLRLLTDPDARRATRIEQQSYVEKLAALDDGVEVLGRLIERERAGA